MFNLNLSVNNSNNENNGESNSSTTSEPSSTNPELTADEVRSSLFSTISMTIPFTQIRRRRLERVSSQASSNDSNKGSVSQDYAGESPKKKQQRDSYDTPSKTSVANNVVNTIFSSPMDTNSKLDRDVRSLNLILESSLLSTLRSEAANESVSYVGDYIDCNGNMLNSTNISEVICSRLANNVDRQSAITYLCNSYKRLILKETAAPTQIQPEVAK